MSESAEVIERPSQKLFRITRTLDNVILKILDRILKISEIRIFDFCYGHEAPAPRPLQSTSNPKNAIHEMLDRIFKWVTGVENFKF